MPGIFLKTIIPSRSKSSATTASSLRKKAIKAVIVSLHWPTGIPKSHDLSFLLNQIHNYISIPDAIGDAADALTPFGTMTRYPNELTVEEHHAKQAIAFAEQILNWTASALR